MTRTGYLREIVERYGGKVFATYSDGPLWRQKASSTEFYQATGHSIKLVTETSDEAMEQILTELRLFGALAHDVKRAYLTRPYKGQGGHLRVEFNHSYTDFRRMKNEQRR